MPPQHGIEGFNEQINEQEYAFCWNGESYSSTSDDEEETDLDHKTTPFHSFDAANEIDYKSDTKFVMQIRMESIQKSKTTNCDTPSTVQRLKNRDLENVSINKQTNRQKERNTWQLHKGSNESVVTSFYLPLWPSISIIDRPPFTLSSVS